MVLKLHALRRTAANRIDVASRLSVRTTAACRLFPSGEALPSTPPPEVAFLCSVAPRYYGLIRLLIRVHARRAAIAFPSRPGQVRARVRPPRFRTKNFSTCTRSPTARGCRTSCITRGRGGWLDLPRGGLAPPILCQLPGAHCFGSRPPSRLRWRHDWYTSDSCRLDAPPKLAGSAISSRTEIASVLSDATKE
jgi:hypothetical protein